MSNFEFKIILFAALMMFVCLLLAAWNLTGFHLPDMSHHWIIELEPAAGMPDPYYTTDDGAL